MEPITILIVCGLLAWGAKSVTDHKKEDTKQKKLKAQSEVDLAKINADQEAIKLRDTENAKLKKEKEESVEERETKEKKLQELEKRVNDPNLSQREKNNIILEITALRKRLEELKDNEKTIDNKIKDNDKKNDESRKRINNIDPSNYKDGFDIKDYLTIETAVIVGGCIIVYKLLKDKD